MKKSLKGHPTIYQMENNVYPNGDRFAVGGNPVEKLRRDAMQLRRENALLEKSNLKLEDEKKILERRLRQATVQSHRKEQLEWKHEIEQSLIKVGDEMFFVVDEYKVEYTEKLSVENVGCAADKKLVKKEEYSEKSTRIIERKNLSQVEWAQRRLLHQILSIPL